MRKMFALFAVVASAFAAAAVVPVGRASPAAVFKTCSAGYVHARLSWGEKCLRAGEFCKVGNSEYHPYGFDCPPTGHLVLSSGSRTRSHPTGGGGPTTGSEASCGVERWTTKTLQD